MHESLNFRMKCINEDMMKAKVMIGLRRSKVRLSETTPLSLHNVVIRAGNLSLEVLDWAIEVI